MHRQIQLEGWGALEKKRKWLMQKIKFPICLQSNRIRHCHPLLLHHKPFWVSKNYVPPLPWVLRLTTNSSWHGHTEVGILPSSEQAQPSVGSQLVERSRQACSPCSSDHHTQLGPAPGAAPSLSVSHLAHPGKELLGKHHALLPR